MPIVIAKEFEIPADKTVEIQRRSADHHQTVRGACHGGSSADPHIPRPCPQPVIPDKRCPLLQLPYEFGPCLLNTKEIRNKPRLKKLA